MFSVQNLVFAINEKHSLHGGGDSLERNITWFCRSTSVLINNSVNTKGVTIYFISTLTRVDGLTNLQDNRRPQTAIVTNSFWHGNKQTFLPFQLNKHSGKIPSKLFVGVFVFKNCT